MVSMVKSPLGQSPVVWLQRAVFPLKPDMFVNKHLFAFFERTYLPVTESAGCRFLSGLAFSKWPLISKMAAAEVENTKNVISMAIVYGF